MGYAGTLMRWLVSGEVDAALLYGAERSAEVHTIPLIEEPLWVIGPKAAGLRRDKPVALADLAGRKLVLPRAPHGICTLVRGGHGLTILPPIAVAEDLKTRKLSGAPLADPPVA